MIARFEADIRLTSGDRINLAADTLTELVDLLDPYRTSIPGGHGDDGVEVTEHVGTLYPSVQDAYDGLQAQVAAQGGN